MDFLAKAGADIRGGLAGLGSGDGSNWVGGFTPCFARCVASVRAPNARPFTHPPTHPCCLAVSEGEQQGNYVALLGNLLFPLIAFAGLFLLFRRAGDGSVSFADQGGWRCSRCTILA